MLLGYATKEGTATYQQRVGAGLAPGHFREADGVVVSSIGLGTYLGEADSHTDALYAAAIERAVAGGINVLDTAINYRHQRSERVIGQVLARMQQGGVVSREEVVVATKGGYIAFDGTVPPDPRAYVYETVVKTGLAGPDEIVEWNCITPRYIEAQVERSLRNLGLACIDIYYLHNPEAQLQKWSRAEFVRRVTEAFAVLEAQVAAGKIRRYGTATWNGYRQPPTARDSLSLAELVAAAEQAGGQRHHFKVLQLPYNLAMTEALTQRNQRGKQSSHALVSILEAARDCDMTVMASATVLQGRLTQSLPVAVAEAFSELSSDAQRAIQFTRSTPGITTALVGMKTVAHVDHNLEVAKVPPASFAQLRQLFRSRS
ncbi:MAG: aldo/keto reductase [Candidatus Binatia bacterium]|nr:aldo/keto reductase [Candidatus Binatia bacterium]